MTTIHPLLIFLVVDEKLMKEGIYWLFGLFLKIFNLKNFFKGYLVYATILVM